MNTYLLHCSVGKFRQFASIFHEKCSGLLENIPFQVCNYTDTVKHWQVCSSSYCSSFNFKRKISNYWIRFSMISWIINAEVWVICRSRRLRWITQTRGLIIHNILCELSSIIVLYIFQRICLKKTLLSEFAKVWENYIEKGPENLVYFELDIINAVSTADILLIECSLPMRLIILSPMWNITVIVQLKSLKRIMWNVMKKGHLKDL